MQPKYMSIQVVILRFALQIIPSSFKLAFTKTTDARTKNAAQRYGKPHPTPKATCSSREKIRMVVITAIPKNPTPQTQLSLSIIFRNKGLDSYRLITARRAASSPRASIEAESSMIARSAGRKGDPFGVEDISNGRGTRKCVRIEVRRNRIPR